MKYIDYTPGGPEILMLKEGEMPSPGPGEILIEVAYAGVNRPDLIQREGKYPPPPGASPILGLEVAGRIAALGDGVTEWAIGDVVTALAPGGGYAEYCTVPASHALPVPTDMSLADAAALPETWFTVWANLVEIAQIQAGERVLIHGGSSGIGLAAIQLAKLRGCEVFVTVGNGDKAEACRAFGADHAILYRDEDFLTRIREITAKEGVDVVLDMVGAPYMQKNVSLLRKGGRLVSIAFLEGSRTEFDFMPVMMRRLTITGSTLRPRSVAEKAVIRDALRAEVWPALSSGAIKVRVQAVYPWTEAAEAHRLMASSAHIGKIVLAIR